MVYSNSMENDAVGALYKRVWPSRASLDYFRDEAATVKFNYSRGASLFRPLKEKIVAHCGVLLTRCLTLLCLFLCLRKDRPCLFRFIADFPKE